MDGRYNTRSPAVKRLMREAQELSEPTDQYFAQPLDDNLFEWHFTIRGPADSDFQNGIFHGRIVLPVDYPMKPPSIIWLTPNGRFETNKKICLSISGHHPESWQPSWSIRTALLAIIGFMPTHPGGAIGALDYTPEERKTLAKRSKDWKCPTCGDLKGILLEVSANTQQTSNEAKELAAQINLQGEKPKCKDTECPIEQARKEELQAAATSTTTTTSTLTQPSSTVLNQTGGEEPGTNICNNTTNTQPELNPSSPTVLSSSGYPHPYMPLPQWPPAMAGAYPPMPMFGFPFQFGGMLPIPPMSPPAHFPYPPSHYTAAMSSWPYPPTADPNSTAQSSPSSNNTNNIPNSSSHTSLESNAATANVSANMNNQYSRTPMTSPSISHSAKSNFSAAPANVDHLDKKQDANTEQRGGVFKELLTKVKRVGSDPKNANLVQEVESSSVVEGEDNILQKGAEKSDTKDNRSDSVSGRQKVLTLPRKTLPDEATDSDMSKSLRRVGDASEKGNTEENNSEADAPPIEADHSPVTEKGACSSTPELEKLKQKHPFSKGLRHRQSAASVNSTVSEEGAAELLERPSTPGQTIEAASGDTGSRNRSRHSGTRAGNAAPNIVNRQQGGAGQNRDRAQDFSFYLMVGLLAASMVILLNRLASMDWDFS